MIPFKIFKVYRTPQFIFVYQLIDTVHIFVLISQNSLNCLSALPIPHLDSYIHAVLSSKSMYNYII